MPSRNYAVRVADGGRLNTAVSLENVGAGDYTRKLNLRRFKDQEARREGWQIFFGSTQYVFDATEPVLRIAELVRPNGDRVVVGAGRTTLKKYNTSTNLWSDIAGGLVFSASGLRWQAETLNGYLILNNGVDLPVSYRVEDAAVAQIKEMRQVGIARVGRLCEFNGFLEIADITEIKAVQLDVWMNGYGSYTQVTNSAKVANFNVLFAEHQNRYDVTTGAGTITATLPAMTFSNRPFYVWIKKVDAGAGTVVTSPLVADEPLILTAVNDIALLWWNGTAWAAKVFDSGTIPATDPYGTPPTAITNRLAAWVGNSEFSEPTRWAPLFSAMMAAAATTIVLPFVPSTWVAGQTRVAVVSGGPFGTLLGGQEGYESGVLITAIGAFSAATMGATITLETTTDVDIDYPRNVQVTRWTDISTIVARYNLQGDGSPIIGLMAFGDLLMVVRPTGFYVGRYTGDLNNPFVFDPRYQGINVPWWGDCIANVNGDYILYPTSAGRFYKFDGVSYPVIHPTTDDAAALFFTSTIKQTTECQALYNPATREWWFCNGLLVLAFDTEFNTASEIDAAIGAGAWVMKPAATDQWFVLGIGLNVYLYGLVRGVTPIQTWWRPMTWTVRSAAAANGWRGVAWSPTLGLFAAVANTGAGNRVMTSLDGTTWTIRVSAANYAWNEICWGNGLFVAVANTAGIDSVMTSPDGINWTLRTTPNHAWLAVAWSGSVFCAVGTDVAMTSPDGIVWTDRTPQLGSWNAIAFGAGVFVAVASTNEVMTSPTGVTWTFRSIPVHAWLDVAWSPDLELFAVVGTGGIATSPDGITWTDRGAPPISSPNAIEWSPELGIFAALASSGTDRAMTSPDGTNWTAQAAAEANSWVDLAWSPSLGLFAAVAIGGTNRVMTSGTNPSPHALLKSGLISAGDLANEKLLLSFTPVLASASGDAAVEIQLRSGYNPSGTLTDLLVPVESLPNPQGENFITTLYQANFFQSQIELVDARDIDLRLTEQIYEFERVGRAGGVTRRIT